MKKERMMQFDLFVCNEFCGAFRCPYDDTVTLEENTDAARNSFLSVFEAPVATIVLKNIVVA